MSNRAVIYARFSTDLQSERSIDDQVALCRAYAVREKLDVVAIFDDRARSGASLFGRDGLLTLMERAREGAFEFVIVEALDRLSRDMEDLAGIHKRLTFLGIELRAVHDGRADTVMVGLRGLVGQMFREDGAKKVRRGMSGVIRDGRHAGGRAYGYRPVPGQKGRLAIVPDERDVILRIFTEYAAGRSPRSIAHDLNYAGIAPPRGGAWNASTLNGNGKRACGILRNRIYVGEMVWNRVRMVKDPDTGRRVSRPNPEREWQTTQVPEMAIVPADLFEQVQLRKAEWSAAPRSIQQRNRHLLSGLLRCGCCGAGMSTKGRDKSGRIRIGCSAAIESGICPAPQTFYLRAVERAVLSGLRRDFRHPKLLAEFVREYHEERRRLAGQATADRARIERRLAEVAREADRITDMLIRGVGNEAKLDARAKELAQEEGRLAAELEGLPDTPRVVTLHPAIVAYYEEALGRLEEALDACSRAGDQEPASALRDLVDTVTVWRDPEVKGGVEVEISESVWKG